MTGCPPKIKELIERFRLHLDQYKSGAYNETQVRREFIDPMFKELGWDIDNENGNAEAYKDVIHEDAIKIGAATKAPDYCFRIGGHRKFFLEAKKPSVYIKEDAAPAFQVRRYAWSAKLPLSILTDFEEFAVYDCRMKPDKADKASVARVMYFTFEEYEAKWGEIASVFSKDAILKGSFDRYAESTKRKKGTAEVDNAFLAEIEKWRDTLAKNIALRNPALSQRDLNYAVQTTIDRIIFLRICEDRGIEIYGRLLGQTNGVNIYPRLLTLFYEADDKYNSGLFHFKEERGRPESPDTLSTSLKIDDQVLKDILASLYYPDCPYEFSVLPADILGQVYEQFLGKVIRLTAGHRAVVEDKPEVKKAGGVYYTPTYIVDYIVKNTVGKLLEGKSPKQAAKLTILDPACGSGSFLLGAYQYLLDWHRDWYVAHDPASRKKEVYRAAKGEWRLTIQERKRILLNNIYGVDIDSQAVETTKLSLLLKVLEQETEETVKQTLKLFHERALPDLAANIKCGNSLIGPDFYNGQQMSLLDDEERYRINVFDWNAEFPAVMKGGGFDAVIGNPPYGAYFGDKEELYFKNKFAAFSEIKDVYTLFIERGIKLITHVGILSMIVPSACTGGPSYLRLRKIMLDHAISVIVMLPFDVFKDAYIDTLIFILEKQNPRPNHFVRTFVFPKKERLENIHLGESDYSLVKQMEWDKIENNKFVLNPRAIRLMRIITNNTKLRFADVVTMKRGVLFDKQDLTKSKESKLHYRHFAGDVYRYHINEKFEGWIEYGPKLKEKPKDAVWFDGHRILLRRLINRQQRMMACMTSKSYITNKNLYSLLSRRDDIPLEIILAVINSRLVSYLYIEQVSQAVKDDFPQVTIADVLALPFPSFSGKSKAIASLQRNVAHLIAMQSHLLEVNTPHEGKALQRQISVTDSQIDQLVYELYGLTDEEIKIVEGATR